MYRIPVTLLNSVSVSAGSPVTSSAFDLGEVHENYAIQVNVSGFSGSGTIAVDLYGSLDGVNYYPGALINIPGGTTAAGVFIEVSSTPVPARYLQAYTTVFSGTPSATVTLIAISS